MTGSTDGRGYLSQSLYDPDGQLLTETWYASDGVTVLDTLRYSYDGDGNLLTASDNNGGYSFSYDPDGRLLSEAEPFGVSLSFGYDPDGDRTLVQDSFGGLATSAFDGDGRLTSRKYTGPGLSALRFDLGYDPDGRLSAVTRFSDLAGQHRVGSSSLSYDPAGRLTDLQHSMGNAVLDYAYGYDAAGRLTSETDNHGTPTTYSYDADNQLLGDGTRSYSYDGAGNRTGGGYQTGPANELTNDGTWAYSYDAEGNLVKKTKGPSAETWTYGYDNDNHLIWAQDRASDGGTLLSSASYVYDVFGDRIEKDVTSGGTTTTTRFAYDGPNVWADLTNADALQTRYLDGDTVDQLFARESSAGVVAWYLTDRLGSVRGLANGGGYVQDQLSYDGYGNLLSESSPSYGDRYKYAGREYDAETGDYYDRARPYDPRLGRFDGQDPLGLAAGDTNLYRYVGNEPTGATDPTGQDGVPAAQGDSAVTWDWQKEAKAWQDYGKDWQRRQALAQGRRELATFQPAALDLDVIPADRVRQMVKDGLAKEWKGFVAIADVAPDGGVLFLLLAPYRIDARDGPDNTLRIHEVDTERKHPTWYLNDLDKPWFPGDRTYYHVLRLIRTPPVPEADQATAVANLSSGQNIQKQVDLLDDTAAAEAAQAFASVYAFVHDALPFGAMRTNLDEGRYAEAALSVVGDLAMFFGFAAGKLGLSARAVKYIRLSVAAAEGGLAATRGAQGFFALQDGQAGKAVGYFGEATLRLMGFSSNMVLALKEEAAAASALEKAAAAPNGGPGGAVRAIPADFTNPKPNTLYESNGYYYRADTQGRLSEVSGNLRLGKAPRNTPQQVAVGASSGVVGDEGGHMIGAQFQGLGEGPLHMVPQARNLNRGAGSQWTAMEREWAAALGQGHAVSVRIEINWPQGATRPTSFDVTYTITNRTTGAATVATKTFSNR